MTTEWSENTEIVTTLLYWKRYITRISFEIKDVIASKYILKNCYD